MMFVSKRLKLVACAVSVATFSASTLGKVSEEEAAQLGLEGTVLTPLGAIRAGNSDGSIPAWEGGIKAFPDGYRGAGNWYVDPYSEDVPLFTITADNYAQYQELLTPGQIALLTQYPDRRKMHVYPTRRSFSAPEKVYISTMKAARQTEICDLNDPKAGIHCLKNVPESPQGIPFPIPKNGAEAMWSHQNYYYGEFSTAKYSHILMSPGGERRDVVSVNWFIHPRWWAADAQPAGSWFNRKGGTNYCLAREMIAPARAAGQVFSGCNYTADANFEAYLYIPGQRRVRKAPEIGFYDSPSFGSDGQQMADQANMFLISGTEARYEYRLVGRKELLVPYNNYAMATSNVSFDDLFQPNIINSDLVRFEKHRVWEIEMTLRSGYRHLSPRRFTWIDEDSWVGETADLYDSRGSLWRVSEGFPINFYDVPMTHVWGEIHYDLPSGGYTTSIGFPNDLGAPPDFRTMPPIELFTAQGLRQFGLR
jgi:hypothetical protein